MTADEQPFPHSEVVDLEGHLIDSWVLPRVFDAVMDHGGEFEVLTIQIGRKKAEASRARIRIMGRSPEHLRQLMDAVESHGASPAQERDAATEPAPKDGTLPTDFYSTTNLPTEVRIEGRWLPVEPVEMDVAIVVDPAGTGARTRPMLEVRKGELVVVGHAGVRVHAVERPREKEIFSFMQSAVSSERPKKIVIHEIAREMTAIRGRGGKIVVVAGPAIIHSGAGPYLGALIREGYVNVLLGGNALAVHDIESAMYSTSLGVNLESAIPVEGGHRHHMRAINAIRRVGSLSAAVESGVLTHGVIYEAVSKGIPMVLAGSIRDDGPMPDVITDVVKAQSAMREAIQGADLVLMIASMLHSIATGNLLPGYVKTVAVDINPAVVTKLADRGSWQAVGLVTDAELFLRELSSALGLTGAFTDPQPNTTPDAA